MLKIRKMLDSSERAAHGVIHQTMYKNVDFHTDSLKGH